jgi:serine/threonine-protein kinase HipA
MTEKADIKVNVFLDSTWLDKPLLLGMLFITEARGKEHFSLEFSKDALDFPLIHLVFPGVQVGTGRYFISDTAEDLLYNILTDSSPDRWGRMLLKKKMLLDKQNKESNTANINLFPSDYLLNISDSGRTGGLRFQDPDKKSFLGSSSLPIPPVTQLRVLEETSQKIEKDDKIDDWISQLIMPGSSLGGTRPKANVIDAENELYIAKFPSIKDANDKGSWEFVVNKLMHKAKLNTPASKRIKLQSDHYSFLVKRFDRVQDRREHFVSAMALTQHQDGDNDCSYLELVEFIKMYGANPKENLKELWKRIIFNIAVSNGDDHLRNHGFILCKTGWILSPVYDVNPGSGAIGFLHLNINETDNTSDYEVALSCAGQYQLDKDEIKQVLTEVYNAVNQWEYIANQENLSKNEIESMKDSFKVNELKLMFNT